VYVACEKAVRPGANGFTLDTFHAKVPTRHAQLYLINCIRLMFLSESFFITLDTAIWKSSSVTC